MVFWYDMTLDGRFDPISLHGACPSLHGVKWGKSNLRTYSNTSMICYPLPNVFVVANKWIREGTQLFIRPCGLTQDEGVLASDLTSQLNDWK